MTAIRSYHEQCDGRRNFAMLSGKPAVGTLSQVASG